MDGGTFACVDRDEKDGTATDGGEGKGGETHGVKTEEKRLLLGTRVLTDEAFPSWLHLGENLINGNSNRLQESSLKSFQFSQIGHFIANVPVVLCP